ncbi:hypothetical protein X798_04359 [Onchocerca flexuosa]|uniref:CX domain-containing protein n=1 Tax=Onchocerca flexuosa TaxID=387005 RepID=A0A238BUH4_9BILA|nr:hypothetical protein X798_04359 [Onchocerca flexuosa]
MLRTLKITFFAFTASCYAAVKCPPNERGETLTCAFACCKSLDATFEASLFNFHAFNRNIKTKRFPLNNYFCCELEDNQFVRETTSRTNRPQRFIAYGSNFQIHYTSLIIGLIVSIILSILCSFFCCLLCNGCWLHRRRNPQLYESVSDGGFYPLCCGFGIPMGTIVFSTHPPQFRDESELYGGSSASSYSNRGRVRFNEDGTPRGVLKSNPNLYPAS